MMRPFASALRLSSRFFSFLFDLNSSKKPSNQKLSKQVIRQVSCLALVYCLFMTLCFIPGTKSSVLAASRNANEKNQKREKREKEAAERANASAPAVTNLPNIDVTRYSKTSLPLQTDPLQTELIQSDLTQNDSLRAGSQFENRFGSRSILKPESTSALEATTLESTFASASAPSIVPSFAASTAPSSAKTSKLTSQTNSTTQTVSQPTLASSVISKSNQSIPKLASAMSATSTPSLTSEVSTKSLTNSATQTFSALLISPALALPELKDVLTQGSTALLLPRSPALMAPSTAAMTHPMQPQSPPTSGYKAVFDFDGDGISDVGRWRESNPAGEWAILKSTNSQTETHTLGSSGNVIVPADYDNDGKTDYAIFNAGSWTVHKSGGGTATQSWGTSGDVPVAADYDGDGKADYAVWRPSTGDWWILQSSTSSYTQTTFGQSGDVTAQADYDGDGYTDIAVFRPSNGYWYILKSSTSSTANIQWGSSGDVPVMGDYDGDGLADAAIYRPSTGTWWALKSSDSNNSYFIKTWGNYGDQPVPGDYDGDEITDYAVWRPSSGVWYIINSDDDSYSYKQIGISTDVAVPSAFLKKTAAQINPDLLAKERLSPKNRTGGSDLYSRNIHWSTGLAGLPGRSGLNAGLSLSYNSLVWIKQDTNMIFDPDVSNVTPGFRFGFPVIEAMSYPNEEIHQGAFMLVSPSGARTELRQTAASREFESADSSYIQLVVDEAQSPNDPVETLDLTLYLTDGTQMKYGWKGGAYRCSEIKDRNGNYITIVHNEYGQLQTITDTLGRVITVNYTTQTNSEVLPTTITQTWGTSSGTTTHTWATFTYANLEIETNFGSLTVYGPPNETTIKVLSKVTYADGSNVRFDYNSYGQVKQINSYAADSDTHKLNYVKFNIPIATQQSDCPRFIESSVWAENWNLDSEEDPQEVTTSYEVEDNEEYEIDGVNEENLRIITITSADGTIDKVYSRTTGWDEGLPLLSETYSSDNTTTPKRSVITKYTQDNTGLSYILNPRVIETKVQDSSNTKRTTIAYWMNEEPNETVSIYGLVKYVIEYDQSATSQYRKTYITYNTDSAYVNRRIIGLVSGKEVYDSSNNLIAKTTYAYDESGSISQTVSAIQHDNTNYSSSFVSGRGNLTSIRRWDATAPTTENQSVRSQIKYNTAGSVVATLDPLNNETTISYTENFKGITSNLNTYAYPTKVFDPENTTEYPTAKTEYDFYTGLVTKTESINNAGTEMGAKVIREYETTTGRLLKVVTDNNDSNANNDPYVRYEYPTSGNIVKTYTTITDVNTNSQVDSSDEAYSAVYTDGLGRTIRTVSEHNLTSNPVTYAITATEYDIMGRVARQSTPTETNSSWVPSGDDAVGQPGRPSSGSGSNAFLWMSYEYDWKGRVTQTTNTDGTTTLASYEGCGCAGGEVVTIQGELLAQGRRKQKIYKDFLGRVVKSQIMNWNGTTPYSTTVTNYTAIDQVTKVTQYNGDSTENNSCTAQQQVEGSCQVATMEYDGHLRLKKRHTPQQETDKFTMWSYYADDKLQIMTDARGATTTYTYNSRGLVTGISYGVPQSSNITVSASISFGYDAVGNRLWMIDGLGRVDYQYNSLSQMIDESRTFSADINGSLPNRSYGLAYTYTFSGQLLSITNPFNYTVNYEYDEIGRMKTLSSNQNGYTLLGSNPQYRSWGALKHLEYGSGLQMNATFNNRLQTSNFSISGSEQQIIQKEYEYYEDGQLKYAEDQLNQMFDRLNKFDHLGRISEARSGAEAREQTESNLQNLPYRQNYIYDAFGNVMGRTGTHWTLTSNVSTNFAYSNLENDEFDEDGRLMSEWVADPNPSTTKQYIDEYSYDAAGFLFETKEKESEENQEYQWKLKSIVYRDGDGLQSQNEPYTYDPNNSSWHGSDPTYYIRSSVLGGKTITQLGVNGYHDRTYIYVGDSVFAIAPTTTGYGYGFVYKDASGMSEKGAVTTEYDPWGSSIGTHYTDNLPQTSGNPPEPFNRGGYGIADPDEYPVLPDGRRLVCYVDGSQAPCRSSLHYLAHGVGYLDPRFVGSIISTNVHGSLHLVPILTPINIPSDFYKAKSYRLDGYEVLGGDWEVVQKNTTFDDNGSFDVDAIKKKIKEALEKTKCKDLIKALLEKVGTKKNPPFQDGDIEKILNSFFSQQNGGYTRNTPKKCEGSSACALEGRSLKKGDAMIYIPKFNFPPNDNQPPEKQKDIQDGIDAHQTIQEIVHYGGANNLYDDYALAKVINENRDIFGEYIETGYANPFDPKDPTYKAAKKNRYHGAYSMFLHGAIRNGCFSHLGYRPSF